MWNSFQSFLQIFILFKFYVQQLSNINFKRIWNTVMENFANNICDLNRPVSKIAGRSNEESHVTAANQFWNIFLQDQDKIRVFSYRIVQNPMKKLPQILNFIGIQAAGVTGHQPRIIFELSFNTDFYKIWDLLYKIQKI